MSIERDFKGVWIPKKIWLNNDLSAIEKCLIVEVDSLDNDERGCFASNEYLGKFLGLSTGRIANIVSDLRKRGYIETVFSNGKIRGLRLCTKYKIDNETSRKRESMLHENVKAPLTKTLKHASRKREHSNTDINTVRVSEENAPAPVYIQSLEVKKIESPTPPETQGPRWQDVPNSNTPREFETYLTRFYANHPQELEYIRERTQFQNNPTGVPAAIADFCAWAVGEGWNRRTLQQINARLGRWLRDQKRFDAANTKPGIQNDKPAPTFVNPQTPIRFAK